MLYHPVTVRLSPFDSPLRGAIFLGDTSEDSYKVLTDSGIIRTKQVQEFEHEFLFTDRLQHDVSFDAEQASTTATASKISSVEISISGSFDDETDAVGDNSHKDTADLDAELLTYTPVYPKHGEKKTKSDDDDGGWWGH